MTICLNCREEFRPPTATSDLCEECLLGRENVIRVPEPPPLYHATSLREWGAKLLIELLKRPPSDRPITGIVDVGYGDKGFRLIVRREKSP